MKTTLAVNAFCDIGLVKPSNEDMILLHDEMFRDGKMQKVFSADDRVIIALADGVGGLNKGDAASEQVLKALVDFLSVIPDDLTNVELRDVFETFTAETHASLSIDMGSTLVGLFLYCGRLYRYHAGDSRIYRYRRGMLERLTVDHSLRESGGQKDAPSNIITNAIGGGATSFIEFAEIEDPFFLKDIYLLSSDGMHDLVPVKEITAAINKPNAAELLVKTANNYGGKDNISVITININFKEK